jgi:integrase
VSSIRTRSRQDGTSYTSVLSREDGTQRSLSFDDPKRATHWRKLLNQVGSVRAPEIASVLDDGRPLITVGSWCTAYIEQLSGIEGGTRRRYRSYVARDVAPTIGATPITALDEVAVGRWMNGLGGAGKPVANKRGFLSAALRGALRAKHIGANPCEGRRLPGTEREEMVFPTPSDFAVLLGYVPT